MIDKAIELNNMKKWNGDEGLPPVGEMVEVYIAQFNSWSNPVKVIGHDADGIIWRNGSDTQSYRFSNEFRPINLEREKALKYADDKWREHNSGVSGSHAREFFAILYDAGMLKLP